MWQTLALHQKHQCGKSQYCRPRRLWPTHHGNQQGRSPNPTICQSKAQFACLSRRRLIPLRSLSMETWHRCHAHKQQRLTAFPLSDGQIGLRSRYKDLQFILRCNKLPMICFRHFDRCRFYSDQHPLLLVPAIGTNSTQSFGVAFFLVRPAAALNGG